MTIKQNGGVFGRNPTFNNVTIDGDLIINDEVFAGLDFQGSWNATTNSPSLASGSGTQGEFYIVSVAGTTDLDGITNWGIGDWAMFNGSTWQRVEGGANGNFNDLTVSGASTLTGNVSIGGAASSGPLNVYGTEYVYFSGNVGGVTPSSAIQGIALGWNKSSGLGESIIAFNKGGGATGGLVFAESNSGVYVERAKIDDSGNLNLNTGNLIVSSGKGIDFSATSGTGTSELFDDYEEGTWTPSVSAGAISGTSITYTGNYTKIGNTVTVWFRAANTAGDIQVSSYAALGTLPFTAASEATGTVTTEDIDQFSRQGFANVSGTTLFLSACGSATGTVKLFCSVTYKV